MTETSPTVKVSANLRAIVDLSVHLEDEAIHKANDHDMPGGNALVALAHVASPETFANVLDGAERRALAAGSDYFPVPEEDEWEPPLQTLLFWSEAWRDELGFPLDGRRPTIETEANFLRNPDVISWAWDNELHWDDFARDVRAARARLESELRAGSRPDRIRVACSECDADRGLIVVHGKGEAEDRWKCPGCKHRFDAEGVRDAYAKQLRGAGAHRWVRAVDATAVLVGIGWQARTVRKWLEDAEGWCDTSTRITWVWWPEVWRRHLAERHKAEVRTA